MNFAAESDYFYNMNEKKKKKSFEKIRKNMLFSKVLYLNSFLRCMCPITSIAIYHDVVYNIQC